MENPNLWHPVTEEYQHPENLSVAAVIEPDKSVGQDADQKAEPRRKSAAPVGLAVITWYYFVRAAVYLIFASVVLASPDSDFAAWLVNHSRILIPYTMVRHAERDVFLSVVAVGFGAVGLLSVVIGVMWLVRYWRIRWITMFYAGAMLARTSIFFLSDKAAGLATPLTDLQSQQLGLGCAVNLLLLGYLAFYPGVAQEFERPI